MTQNAFLLLCAAGLVLSVAAVLIDRLNFPQQRFRPKSVEIPRSYSSRDRTGAHVNTLKPHSSQTTSASQTASTSQTSSTTQTTPRDQAELSDQ